MLQCVEMLQRVFLCVPVYVCACVFVNGGNEVTLGEKFCPVHSRIARRARMATHVII